MSLPNYLAKIKSSGVYRFVWDKSVVPSEEAETLRLLVGYSEKGPFNTPVYFDNTSDFINTFGNISKRLERKGVFFHRMALQALSAGPILALNLKPFRKTDTKLTNEQLTTEDKKVKTTDGGKITYTDDAELTYSISSANFIKNGNDTVDIKFSGKLLNGKEITLTQYSKKDCKDVVTNKIFEITQKEGSNCVGGTFTDGKFTVTAPVEESTSQQAAKKTTKSAVAVQAAGDTLVDVEFTLTIKIADNASTGESYVKIVSNTDDTKSAIIALNYKELTITAETVQFINFNASDTSIEIGSSDIDSKVQVYDLYNTNRFWGLDFDMLPNKLNPTEKKYIYITATDTKDSSCTLFIRKSTPESYNVSINDWYANNSSEEMPDYLESVKNNKLNEYFYDIYVFKGQFTDDMMKENGSLGNYIDNKWNGYFTQNNDAYIINTDYTDIYGEKTDALEALANDPNSNFIAKYTGTTIPYFKNALGNYISIDILFNKDYNSHKMLMKLDESYIEERGVNAIKPTQTDVNRVYLEGYTYNAIDKTTKGSDLVAKCLEMLDNKGIRTALTNRIDTEYHYLVDTFQSYIGSGCKTKLSLIAKEKENAFAILNFPPINEFIKNSNDYFTKNLFDITKIFNDPNKFSLAKETEGASYCGYFTNLIFTDGSLKTTVPSAALVSNNFIEKFGSRKPYYIVAGPTYGTLSYEGLVGPDYNYCRSDLDVLEPAGVNAIIYVPRKGTYINSNQTAKQVPVSALSKIHVRELVIYLQDEIENMMQNYQWELNTQTLRDTIKAKADTILENVMQNGGIYAYENVCDESNNTNEVIDNEMIILDTAIEPARGAGKMIQQLTIYKTGDISSKTI